MNDSRSPKATPYWLLKLHTHAHLRLIIKWQQRSVQKLVYSVKDYLVIQSRRHNGEKIEEFKYRVAPTTQLLDMFEDILHVTGAWLHIRVGVGPHFVFLGF